jgi:hypothetical protein
VDWADCSNVTSFLDVERSRRGKKRRKKKEGRKKERKKRKKRKRRGRRTGRSERKRGSGREEGRKIESPCRQIPNGIKTKIFSKKSKSSFLFLFN